MLSVEMANAQRSAIGSVRGSKLCAASVELRTHAEQHPDAEKCDHALAWEFS